MAIRAFLVDDEPLAVKRLSRMLASTGRTEVVGTRSDPVDAVDAIVAAKPDVLFLDIEMPGMNGFQMLAKLDPQPLIVFTTAYDQYALQAFGVNSVDYLLKPIEPAQLNRALDRVERIAGGAEPRPEIRQLLEKLAAAGKQPEYPDRIASKTGERVEFVELSRITHFFASDKLTYASTPAKNFMIDHTIQELERKLDPRKFLRIHRATLLNVDYVHELHSWFAGRMVVRLKDEKKTELTVSRDRVKALKQRLGI
jgi:two-component system, LytTR family, response regulator